MRPLVLLSAVLFVLISLTPAPAKTPYLSADELQGEAQRGFGEILDLWRDGRYDLLYDRTIAGGKGSKEQFARKLAAAGKKPACCWEKMQEVKVSVKNDYTVTLKAKVGMEGEGAGTDYVTRSFRLQKEDGVWCISQSDIFSLAGERKKKHSKSKKRTDQ
ncbi:hypothetical protein [Geotalea sp. SG265]|uniref:hypothetical protein n=1 Tax=Geotalea sp. SG265 TaxID=2922867 RepID=UPI001FAFBD95|nr:hypothetical protein [Geotalea sp. SG265]